MGALPTGRSTTETLSFSVSDILRVIGSDSGASIEGSDWGTFGEVGSEMGVVMIGVTASGVIGE